ncbi:hypothetical protein [Vallitalea okinawensis]|uniref:hypothetical protein n=1 Tax=Vallitalea okinawensis TaxID=2078660 RepID=UPI000CFD43C1|nr:hypothetical protein [Vallitalea okinawensis]
MYNSVTEERFREEENYRIYLTVPRNEYASIYEGDINESNAYDFIKNYLNHISDDGRPIEVHVRDLKDSDLFQIEAELRYEGNGHTDYQQNYRFTNSQRDE